MLRCETAVKVQSGGDYDWHTLLRVVRTIDQRLSALNETHREVEGRLRVISERLETRCDHLDDAVEMLGV